jgi:hypothetical protein
MTPQGRHEYEGPERRQRRRRELDEESAALAESIDGAASGIPVVSRWVRASERVTKIGGAGLLIGGVLGGLATGVGVRIVGPRDAQAQLSARVSIDSARITSTNVRFDSLANIVRDIAFNLRADAYGRCLQTHHDDTTACRP